MTLRHAAMLVPLLLGGCTQGTDPVIANDTPLNGSFQWVQSVGGIAGIEYSPTSVGYTVRLDYEGNRVRAFRDGSLVGESQFSIREDSLRMGPARIYIVEYEPALPAFTFSFMDQHTVRVVNKGMFEFDEGCCDRYNHTFQKPGVR